MRAAVAEKTKRPVVARSGTAKCSDGDRRGRADVIERDVRQCEESKRGGRRALPG